MRLHEKWALITGGSSGIGRSIAETFIAQGCNVVIWSSSKEKGSRVALELAEHRVRSEQFIGYNGVDVAITQDVEAAIAQYFAIQSRLDIVVNCAGVTQDALLMKMSEEQWDSVIDTNLKSLYNVCHSVIRPMMKQRCGSIINIGSVVGLIGNAGQVNYASAKAGMIGFTKALAIEVAARGICVNCIAPGFIKTPMTDKLTAEQQQAIAEKIPLARLGEAKEVANTALFLASDGAYITGQVITVDGGMSAQ